VCFFGGSDYIEIVEGLPNVGEPEAINLLSTRLGGESIAATGTVTLRHNVKADKYTGSVPSADFFSCPL